MELPMAWNLMTCLKFRFPLFCVFCFCGRFFFADSYGLLWTYKYAKILLIDDYEHSDMWGMWREAYRSDPSCGRLGWYQLWFHGRLHALGSTSWNWWIRGWLCIYIYILLLVGGIPTPLKTMSESQLGWWNSQYMGSHKIHVPNHQSVYK